MKKRTVNKLLSFALAAVMLFTLLPGVTVDGATKQKSDQPTVASTDVSAVVDMNGHTTVTITDSMVSSLIDQAREQAETDDRTANGVGIQLNAAAGAAAKIIAITITANAIERLNSEDVKLFALVTPLVNISFNAAAIKEINTQATGDVTVTITPEDKLSDEAKGYIGSRPVYNVSVSYQKSGVTSFITDLKGGAVTLGITYTPASDEKRGSLFAVYVPKSGKPELLNKSSYNDGHVILTSNTLSVYGVGYKTPAPVFTDTANHWAKDNIDFAVSRGLLSGTSDTAFSPDTAVTRGMFITALGRLSGADMSGYTKSSFSDVAEGSYYLPYIEWAVESKIVSGVGNGKFAPDKTITRQEIAIMTANYAASAGYTLPVVREVVTYADNASISARAKAAVKALQQAGVMSGVDNNRFNPKGTATRAEVATILRNFTELVIDTGTARGWSQNETGQWMYYNQSGRKVTGWLTTSGGWYYFNTNGKLAVSVYNSPTSSTYDSVTGTVTTEDNSGVSFIGWRLSSNGASYTDIDGFTDITKTGKFTVLSNGWYAVGIVDSAGNFSYTQMQITNISTASEGTSKSGNGVSSSVAVTGVTLDANTLTLTVGDTQQLTATVTPSNATDKNVTWSSSDTNVATVNNGLVTAVSAGSTTITVTLASCGYTASCIVTIIDTTIPVTGVNLYTSTTAMTVNKTLQLTATIIPANATNQRVTWSSSNETVAAVDGSGLVIAVAPGNADITVTTEDGRHTATCNVTVNELVNAKIPNITAQPTNVSYYVSEPATSLTVTADVNDGGTLSYEWYSNTMESNTGGQAITSADKTSYTPPTNTTGITYYYVVVTNTITDNGDGGVKTATITSSVAVVTVNALVNAEIPSITNQPAGVDYDVGDNAVPLTVTTNVSDGGTLSYQWYSNVADSTTGGNIISGATAGNYTPLTDTVGTTYYYVVVTNTNTNVSGSQTAVVTSNVAEVTVNAAQTYTLMHNVSGNAHTFSDATVGYNAQTPLTATITNIGNSSLTGGTIVLTDGSSFELSKTTLDATASGSADTFMVIPKTGLTAGVYSDTVTVTGTPGDQTASFTVSFTVSAAPLSFDTPSFSGTLKVGQVSNGKLSIHYTNATGTESYYITASVSGMGADGIYITDINERLRQGNGIIEIPITGTPITAGRATFTISGIAELTSNTVTVNVSPFAGGNGSQGSPYQIDSAAGLAAMADGLTAHYILTDDITVTAWTPIGDIISGTFKGSLDGNGQVVTFNVDFGTDYQCAGLFGAIGNGGKVKNLTVAGAVTTKYNTSSANIGGIVGILNNGGTIENCAVSASISATGGSNVFVGGVVGYNSGTITNSYATGAVTSTASGTSAHAGGVVGYNEGTITNSYATGVVTSTANGNSAYAGGVAGRNEGTITNSYAKGTVTSNTGGTSSYVYAGGVAGYNNGTITNSYATGAVTSTVGGTSAYAGGIVGNNSSSGSITNCAALNGSVSAARNSGVGGTYTGRVAGDNNSTLTNNYANNAMWVNNVTVNDDGNNGTGVGSNAISNQSWWTNSSNWSTVWDFTVWNWDNGNSHLPYLNASHMISISSLSLNATRMLMLQTATLTLDTSGSGVASHDGKYGDTFLVGDTVTITATPEADYMFVEWQDEIGEVMSTDAEYSFEITEDMTLTAVFMPAEETQEQGDNPADTPDSEDEPEQQDEQKQDEQHQDADTDDGDNTDVAPEPEPAILPQDEDEPEDTGDDSNVGNEAPENNDEEDGSEAIEE